MDAFNANGCHQLLRIFPKGTVATNHWKRINNILVETDDGVTDNDDNDTGSDWVSETFYKFKIDLSNKSDVKFYVDDVDVTPETMSLASITSSNLLQPIVEVQIASSAEIGEVHIDYINCLWDRS